MSADAPTRDELARWLRSTEAKLPRARRVLQEREAAVAKITGRGRGPAAAEMDTQRRILEGTEATVARIKAELGLAPVPTECFRTDGYGHRCELPFGHVGLHQVSGEVRKRWE